MCSGVRGLIFCLNLYTPDKRQSKRKNYRRTTVASIIVRNRVSNCHLSPDCRHMAIKNTVSSESGDKWQLETLFLTIFDRRSSIAKSVHECRLSGVLYIVPCHMYANSECSEPLVVAYRCDSCAGSFGIVSKLTGRCYSNEFELI